MIQLEKLDAFNTKWDLLDKLANYQARHQLVLIPLINKLIN